MGYMHHIRHLFGEIWPQLDDFIFAAKQGSIELLTEPLALRLDNLSHLRTMEELVQLVSAYQSWPEYRNMDTLRDMIMRFKRHAPLTMPIVLDQQGCYFLMAGNTKLNIAFMMGIVPKILVVSI